VHDPSEVTIPVRAWSGGEDTALDWLAERVYRELHRIARHYMKNARQENTLHATAPVREWRERARFYAWRRR